MKKNGLLTFLFACIPGAGQMYYGYMQRGLSLITLFCLGFFFGIEMYSEWLMVLVCGVTWMYSFFDTYDLIRYAAAGRPKEDGLLLMGNLSDLTKYIPQHNKLLGWILVGIGSYGVYSLLIEDILYTLLRSLLGSAAYSILRAIPGIIISILFIAAGLWLLGLRPPQKPVYETDLPPYPQGSDPAPADFASSTDQLMPELTIPEPLDPENADE